MGDRWIVNGQKAWTIYAHHTEYSILVACTDWDVRKYEGLSYFVRPAAHCRLAACGLGRGPAGSVVKLAASRIVRVGNRAHTAISGIDAMFESANSP